MIKRRICRARFQFILAFRPCSTGAAFALIAVLLIGAATAIADLKSAEQAQSASPDLNHSYLGKLEPGTSIKREIAGGKTHSYRVTLASDQFLRAVIHQRDIDVSVRLIGPDGIQITEARNILDTARPERISFVADKYGDYSLEVVAIGNEEDVGNYEMRVEELRIATPEDRSLTAAEKLYREAERLHAQPNPRSRREAIKKYEQALPLWQQARDLRGEADTLQYLSNAYYLLGESEKAVEYLTRARPLYRAAGDSHGESLTLQGLGLMNHLSGNLHRALEYYKQGLELHRELRDRWEEAGTLNNIGGVYSYMGEHQKALEYYKLSLPLHRDLKDQRGEAVTLNNIGEVYRILGDNQRALSYYEKSLPLRRRVKDLRGEAVTLNNIGLVYMAMGEYRKALERMDESLKLKREVGYRFGEASTLNGIGAIYHKLNDYEKALEILNQALELRRAVGDRRGEANTLYTLGSVYFSMGKPARAMEYFNRALPLSRSVWDRILEMAILYSIADIERERDNLLEARSRADEALAIIESLRSNVAGQELRESFFASKQNHYELYVDVLMQLHHQSGSDRYDVKAFEASERARARSLLDTLSEVCAGIRQGVDPALFERERRLQQQLNGKEALRMQLLRRKNAEKKIEAMERAINDLLNQYREIRTRIRIESPRYAALSDPQPLNLEEVQRLVLDDESLLLEYWLGEKRSYLWAVTTSSITGYTLPARAEIESATRRVYELLTARNERPKGETPRQRQSRVARADGEYMAAARRLSRMLLGPVAARLGNRRLLIVGDGALHYLPFGALPLPQVREAAAVDKLKGGRKDATGLYKPLVIEHEIVTLPSASVLAVLRREINGRKPAPKLVAVLADPVFRSNDPRINIKPVESVDDPIKRSRTTTGLQVSNSESVRPINESEKNSFRRLRFSRQEANAIIALVPAEKSLKAIDFAASHAMAMGTQLEKYRILHFATHGLLDSRHPELSGIVLSLVDEQGRPQDGFLRLHEIYNLKLNADLVVLSACQTALGKEIKGEGLVGLTRGFMYAGAPRVVASLWSVEDRATAELMKRFYEAMLSKGMTGGAALRAAQVELWKERRWQSPYYWAGFVLQGEWK